MSDMKSQYEEWLLNGRQGPRPGSPPTSGDDANRPRGMPALPKEPSSGDNSNRPEGMPSLPTDHGAGDNSNRPEGMPQLPGSATALEAIWAAMKNLSPSVLGYAGGAAAAHLANPPEANQGEEEYLNALLSGQKGTEHIKQSAADAFKGVTADPAPKGSSPITKTELPHELKDSLKKVSNMPDDLDSRVQDRDAERERIKGQMQAPQPVKSLDELRLRGREMERERIKQQLLRGE